jgi:hypothetical protein
LLLLLLAPPASSIEEKQTSQVKSVGGCSVWTADGREDVESPATAE